MGPRLILFGAAPREREEGRAGLFTTKTLQPFYNPKSTSKSACATTQDARLGRRPLQKLTADEVAEEFFDAGLFAGVILLGNRAGLLAQLEAKDFFLQRI